MRQVITALSTLLLFSAVDSADAAWRSELVEDARSFRALSMEIDPNDQTHVAYGGERLYYATAVGGAWQTTVIPTEPYSGSGCELALDSKGSPGIAYLRHGLYPRFASFNGARWVTEAVAPDHINNAPALAYDSDEPVLGFVRSGSTKSVTLARKNGNGWDLQDVATGSRLAGPVALAFNSTGHAGLVYQDHENLYYLQWTGTIWSQQAIADTRTACGKGIAHAELVFDSQDRPVIAYQDRRAGWVRLLSWDGSSWHNELVRNDVAINDVYLGLSLSLDVDDQPYLTYAAGDPLGLELSTRALGVWSHETVKSGSDTTSRASDIEIAADGTPRIVHIDPSERTLELAARSGPGWAVDVIDRSRSLQHGYLVLDGNDLPAAAYSDTVQIENRLVSNIRFARSDGTDWSFGDVDLTSDAAGLPRLALDAAELPAVAFMTGDLQLRFARHDGVSWTSEDITQIGFGGWLVGLAFDTAGDPVLAYAGSQGVEVARHDGVTWSFEEVVPTWNIQWVDLAVAGNGDVYVSYMNEDHDSLELAHSSGGAWTIEVIDSGPGVGWDADLILDSNDEPILTYTAWVGATDDRDLRLATRAGGAWRIETLVSAELQVGRASIAIDSNDQLLVAFSHWFDGDLIAMRRDGAGWRSETVLLPGTAPGAVRPSASFDSNDVARILVSDSAEGAIHLLTEVPGNGIRRGPHKQAPPPLTGAALPWTDPETVLTDAFPTTFYYQVDGVSRIAMTRAGMSVQVSPF